jgi:hypothetical protein
MSCHTGGDKWHAAEQGDEADEGSIVPIVSNMPAEKRVAMYCQSAVTRTLTRNSGALVVDLN